MLTDPNALAAKAWEAIHRFDADAIPPGIRADEIAATAVIAREFEALEAENARLREAVRRAEAVFTHYGELHAAKPDPVKAQRNFDLAEAMRTALGASHD